MGAFMLPVSHKYRLAPYLLLPAYLTTCNPFVRSISVYLLVAAYLLACTHLIALIFSMPKRKLPKDFFQKARDKGSESNKDIVNGDEIRKKLQPKTEKNYTYALKLWHQ
jgi:hypothetical protein